MVARSGTGSSGRCSHWSQVDPALIRAYLADDFAARYQEALNAVPPQGQAPSEETPR